MMLNFVPLLYLLLGIAGVVIVILGLFVHVRNRKLVLVTIGVALIIPGTYYLLTLHNINNTASKSYVGDYALDITKVKWVDYDSIDYVDLRLSIREDGTFSYSSNVPFISQRDGSWRCESIEGYTSQCGLVINDVLMPLTFLGNTLVVQTGSPQSGQKSISDLYFRRIPK